MDVITAKTPEHKEPLVSPNHSTQHKREVFQTKGEALASQPDTKCCDKTPEPGTHEEKKACKASRKEDEGFTASDSEAREPSPSI